MNKQFRRLIAALLLIMFIVVFTHPYDKETGANPLAILILPTVTGQMVVDAAIISVGAYKIAEISSSALLRNIDHYHAHAVNNFASARVSPSRPPNDDHFRKLIEWLYNYYKKELENETYEEFSSFIQENVKDGVLPADWLVLAETVDFYNVGKDYVDYVRLLQKPSITDPLEIIDTYYVIDGIYRKIIAKVENSVYNIMLLDQALRLLPNEIGLKARRGAEVDVANKWRELLVELEAAQTRLQGQVIQVKIGDVDDSYYPVMIAYVSVSDGADNPVDNLTTRHFKIKDSGRKVINLKIIPRKQTRANMRTNIELVFDSSSSMVGEPLRQAQEAGRHFLSCLGSQDYVGLTAFSNQVFEISGLTQDTEALETAIEGMEVMSSTALYDGVAHAVNTLSGVIGRKVIVVLSDGADTSSRTTLEQVIKMANEHGVSVFVVALGNFKKDYLQRLSISTGGSFLATPSSLELQRLYQKVGSLVNSEYKLQYIVLPHVSINRMLSVTVTDEGRRGESVKPYVSRKGGSDGRR